MLLGRSQSRCSPPFYVWWTLEQAARYTGDVGVCLGTSSSADAFGLFPLSPAGCGRPGWARPARLRVPSGCYTPLPRQGVQEGDRKDEDVKDEVRERESSA